MFIALHQRLARFREDRRAVAAIEFAFIAPILMSLYFVTMEVSQGIEANKKVGRIASMVGDLVAQQTTVTTADLDAIMQIGAAIIQPYGRSDPTIIIEHIALDDDANATVQWSRQLVDDSTSEAFVKGSPTTVPDQLEIEDTFLVRVTAKLGYKPVITWTVEQKATLGLMAAFDKLEMSERYFLRPRMSAEVRCGNC